MFQKMDIVHTFLALPLLGYYRLLARAVGVAVGRRSGEQLATTLVATIFIIIFLFIFFQFFPFLSRFSPPSLPFLIEGVLGSRNLFSESDSKCPIT